MQAPTKYELVINPLSRYSYAKRALVGANPPEWPKSIIPRQDAYWRSEANMAEGNPMLALERGERVETPPAVPLLHAVHH